jgi:hypothetical protein
VLLAGTRGSSEIFGPAEDEELEADEETEAAGAAKEKPGAFPSSGKVFEGSD